MRNEIFYFVLGFALMGLLSITIISCYPITETDQACGECGAKAWYFKIAEGE